MKCGFGGYLDKPYTRLFLATVEMSRMNVLLGLVMVATQFSVNRGCVNACSPFNFRNPIMYSIPFQDFMTPFNGIYSAEAISIRANAKREFFNENHSRLNKKKRFKTHSHLNPYKFMHANSLNPPKGNKHISQTLRFIFYNIDGAYIFGWKNTFQSWPNRKKMYIFGDFIACISLYL